MNGWDASSDFLTSSSSSLSSLGLDFAAEEAEEEEEVGDVGMEFGDAPFCEMSSEVYVRHITKSEDLKILHQPADLLVFGAVDRTQACRLKSASAQQREETIRDRGTRALVILFVRICSVSDHPANDLRIAELRNRMERRVTCGLVLRGGKEHSIPLFRLYALISH